MRLTIRPDARTGPDASTGLEPRARLDRGTRLERTSRRLRLAAVLLVLGLGASLASAAPPEAAGDAEAAGPAAPVLTSESDRLIYALGAASAYGLPAYSLDDRELALYLRGIEDVVRGRPVAADLDAAKPKFQDFRVERYRATAVTQRAAAQPFMEQQAAAPGAVRTPSGLIYLELVAGDGATPGLEDKVTFQFSARLHTGTLLEASTPDKPVSRPLGGSLPCVEEGVGRMRVGGSSRFVCPDSLAYGDMGSAPLIMPGVPIVFEVQLVAVEPPAP